MLVFSLMKSPSPYHFTFSPYHKLHRNSVHVVLIEERIFGIIHFRFTSKIRYSSSFLFCPLLNFSPEFPPLDIFPDIPQRWGIFPLLLGTTQAPLIVRCPLLMYKDFAMSNTRKLTSAESTKYRTVALQSVLHSEGAGKDWVQTSEERFDYNSPQSFGGTSADSITKLLVISTTSKHPEMNYS